MILRSLVREARRRAGLTQAALAERAGVAQSTVDPERILGALSDAEVRYVLIGGMAAILHGGRGCGRCWNGQSSAEESVPPGDRTPQRMSGRRTSAERRVSIV